MDDFADMGDGYDEDDPFIDNTEAVRSLILPLTLVISGFAISFKCLIYFTFFQIKKLLHTR